MSGRRWTFVYLLIGVLVGCDAGAGANGCGDDPSGGDIRDTSTETEETDEPTRETDAELPAPGGERSCRRRAVGLVRGAAMQSRGYWRPTRKGRPDLPTAESVPENAEAVDWGERQEYGGFVWIGRYGVQPGVYRWDEPGEWSDDELGEATEMIKSSVEFMVEEKSGPPGASLGDREGDQGFHLLVGVPDSADLVDVSQLLGPAAERASVYLLMTPSPSGVRARVPFAVPWVEERLRAVERMPESRRERRFDDLFGRIAGECREPLARAFGFDRIDSAPFYSLGHPSIDRDAIRELGTSDSEERPTPVEVMAECGCSNVDLPALEVFLVHEFPPPFAGIRVIPFDPTDHRDAEGTVGEWVRSQPAGESGETPSRRVRCLREAQGVWSWYDYTRPFRGNDWAVDLPTVDRRIPSARTHPVPREGDREPITVVIRPDEVVFDGEVLYDGAPLTEKTDEQLTSMLAGDGRQLIRELNRRGHSTVNLSVDRELDPEVLGPLLETVDRTNLHLLVADGSRPLPNPSIPEVRKSARDEPDADVEGGSEDAQSAESEVSRIAGDCERLEEWIRPRVEDEDTPPSDLGSESGSFLEILRDCPCGSVDFAALEVALLEAGKPYGRPARSVTFDVSVLDEQVETMEELADAVVERAEEHDR